MASLPTYVDVNYMHAVQSPIAISSYDSIIDDHMRPLQFYGHSEYDGSATIVNTGHSVKIKFEGRQWSPYINGGPLKPNERYIFEHMHIHWSYTDYKGSEHVVNGQS